MAIKKSKQIAIKGFDMIMLPKGVYETAEEYWNCEWSINTTGSKKTPPYEVGSFRFCGKPENGQVELTIDIKHEFINKGYATAALKAIRQWCFSRSGLYIVNAHIDSENRPALKAFTGAGFVYRSREHGIEHYSVIKPEESWLGLYIIIGVWAGLILAVVMEMPAIGFCIGMLAGFLCGKGMEIRAKNQREKILGTTMGEK